MMQVYQDDDNTWELVKENAAPLERGRDVKLIKKMFGESNVLVPGVERERNENKKLQFEQLIRHSESAWRDNDDEDSDDPLVPWLSYIKFVQEAYPADTQQSFLLMERCTRAFIGKRRYMNDVRFIRVCILYADRTSSPMEVYKYLHSRKIGAKTALFWVAWAWVSEKAGDFAFADKIFKKALSKDAEPKNILEDRQRQFLRRMSRHWLNASSGGDEHESNNEDFASVSGAVRRGNLTAIAAPAAANSTYRLPAVTEESNTSSSQRGSNNTSHKSKAAPAGKFCVYVDQKDVADEDFFEKLHDQPPHQKLNSKMVTESERKKENTLGAEQWSKRGGLAPSAHEEDDLHRVSTTIGGPRTVAPKFEVFVEEGIDENTNKGDENLKSGPKKTKASQRSIRERLDDDNMIGNLVKNPLHYIQNPSAYVDDKELIERKKADAKEKYRVSSLKETTKKAKAPILSQSCLQDKKIIKAHEEECLEEFRAAKSFYRLASDHVNFSLLISNLEDDCGSYMSLEEIDCSMNRSTVMDESGLFNPTSSKKVGGNNQNIYPYNNLNQYLASVSVNDSQASSTVNERDAVGGILRVEEETINTKFARAEMSLMFSSPVHQDSQFSVSKPLFSVCESTNRKAHASVLDISAIPIAESHHKQIYSQNALASSAPATSLGGLFDIYCDDNDKNKVKQSLDARMSGAITCFPDNKMMNDERHSTHSLFKRQQMEEGCTAFSVFGDLMDAVGGAIDDEPPKTNLQTDKFSVFEDKSNTNIKVERQKSRMSGAVICFPDNKMMSDECHSTDSLLERQQIEEGCTASFSVFGDLMDAVGDAIDDEPTKANLKTEKFSIFEDKSSTNIKVKRKKSRMSGAVICFPDNKMMNDKCRCSDSLLERQQMEEGCTASFSVFGDLMDAVDGAIEDKPPKTNLKTAKFSIFEDKSSTNIKVERKKCHSSCVFHSHAEVHNESVGYSLAEVVLGRNVLDRRDMLLPSGLNRSKPVLGLEISLLNDSFLVQNELGRGAHGTVLLCSNMKENYVALKVQSPTGCLAHEFRILSCMDKRMKSRTDFKLQSTHMFPRPIHFVAHGDGGLLAMTTASRSGLNLVDLVNLYHTLEGGQVPELLVLHYVSQMLQYLEILHSQCFILHCDIKPDNWVLTKANERDSVEGSDLMLVDFGRSVDLEALETSSPLDVKFEGSATSKDMECVTMREGRSWSLDLDTYGVCASAYIMLFGSHMDVHQVSSTKIWKTAKPLRRYWNRTLWNMLFETLLNGGIEESRPKKLKQIASAFEEYLSGKNRRKEIQVLLKHQAAMLPDTK